MLYGIDGETLTKQKVMQFSDLHIDERGDLQRLLRAHPSALGEDLLIIAEEFGEWEDSKRRIDLLALDRKARLVVIELKRTEDGGHMELQALRYAAMVSAMTFDEVVAIYAKSRAEDPESAPVDARDEIAEFIGRSEDEGNIELEKTVRIILVSANFGIEITTTVLWLNGFDGMDIKCVRLVPYKLDGKVFLDIQQIIPLPEAGDYQVRLRRKEAAREKSNAAANGRDFTRYHVSVNGEESGRLKKRQAILAMVTELGKAGIPYASIAALLRSSALRSVAGVITDPDELIEALRADRPTANPGRWFFEHPFVDEVENRTWALTKMWGSDTEDVLQKLSTAFPDKGLSFRVADEQDD
jgi:hypothetical protein